MSLLKKWWFYIILLIVIYFILVALNMLPIYRCIGTMASSGEVLKQCGWYLLNVIG